MNFNVIYTEGLDVLDNYAAKHLIIVVIFKNLFLILGFFSSTTLEDTLYELHSNINFRKKNIQMSLSHTPVRGTKNNSEGCCLAQRSSTGRRNRCSKLYRSGWRPSWKRWLKKKDWKVNCTQMLCLSGCRPM